MAIEAKPLEDFRGVTAAPIPELPEIGNETAYLGTISTAAWGVRPAAGLAGFCRRRNTAAATGSAYPTPSP